MTPDMSWSASYVSRDSSVSEGRSVDKAEDVERERLSECCSCGFIDAEEDLEEPDWLDWVYLRPPGRAKTISRDDGRNRGWPRLLRRDHLTSCGLSCVMEELVLVGDVCRVRERPRGDTPWPSVDNISCNDVDRVPRPDLPSNGIEGPEK